MTYPPTRRRRSYDIRRLFLRRVPGRRYSYAEIADRIRSHAPHTLGKHIFVQLEAIGLLDELMNGSTPCGLPPTFAEAHQERVLKTYRVTVIERALAHYEVKADDAGTAAENWQDGEFIGRDDEALDTEGPCSVREQQPDGTFLKLPRSQWEPGPEIAALRRLRNPRRLRVSRMTAANSASRFPTTRLSSGACSATSPARAWSASATSRRASTPRKSMPASPAAATAAILNHQPNLRKESHHDQHQLS